MQMVVKNDEITPGATCLVPSMAACRGARPLTMWAAMFSAITMASSTNRPIAISKPTMVIRSNDRPASDITAMVPMNETGKPIATQKENRILKNSQSVRKTRTSPCAPFFTRRFRRSRTIDDMSRVTSKETSGGARCFSFWMKAFTASITFKVSSVLVLETSRMAARLPLKIILSSVFSNKSVILAIVPSRTSAPDAAPTTIRS